MTDSQIIKNIIAALTNKGIKGHTDLAVAVGYDQGNMSRIYNGKKRISSGLREKIHTKYAVRHEYLLTGSGEIFEAATNFDAPEITSLQHKIKELEKDVKHWKDIAEERKVTIHDLQKSLDALRDVLTRRPK